jgi:hypothetical protein
MSCDDVREHLADHVLGTLPQELEAGVRGHLRGCMACRRDLAALEDGMSTFARAAHQVEPPEALKTRVLSVLAEEQADSPNALGRKRFPLRRIALAAAAVIVLGTSVGVATVQSQQAGRYEALASNYRNFLHALGGKDVRVGTLRATGDQPIQGSVVMYDSDKGQSWILVLARAPGETGQAQVVVSSSRRRIQLHPLVFGPSGEASSWLVTASDISRFDHVRILGPTGAVLATGVASRE